MKYCEQETQRKDMRRCGEGESTCTGVQLGSWKDIMAMEPLPTLQAKGLSPIQGFLNSEKQRREREPV